ncbi:ABC transporter substrate-binding protein [Paralimibaculum aggregatum]|uniref:ABC transporter substrate-binding protein n=2 Tax=Paralimibaculum aggregatum TaxID=3036245 RepID=A0ABQ6LM95_9RHOB|nr:ABC transporter substrate-binding protein [Limibaculum sp. NKW23]
MAAAAAAMLGATALGTGALAEEPIKVGELNSYTRMAAFTDPYKKGWELALEEINAAGGVRGRPLEVISRDDDGKPADAVRIAEELVSEDEVVLLWGTFLSNIGLAVADFAAQREVLFVAAEPLSDAVTMEKGNPYTFRLRPSTGMQARMLAEVAAKLPAKRWATVAPNYAYGQDAVAKFKTALTALRPDVEFVGEQWPGLFKIDAAATVRALDAVEPEAIYNVTFGGDLAKFVREGQLRGLFKGRDVVSLLTGEPEYLLPLGAEAPEGWIVTGYPVEDLGDDPNHKPFLEAYQAKWGELPQLGSIVGYVTLKAVAAAIEKAESLETEDLVAAMENLTFDSPVGPVTFRDIDNQATLGAWVGRTALKDGRGVMVDWSYADGADYMASPEEVAATRPAE